jgi:hypothetical protein
MWPSVSGSRLNGWRPEVYDATCSFRIISRTAVPLLKIYADHPNGSALYHDAMLALLSEKI